MLCDLPPSLLSPSSPSSSSSSATPFTQEGWCKGSRLAPPTDEAASLSALSLAKEPLRIDERSFLEGSRSASLSRASREGAVSSETRPGWGLGLRGGRWGRDRVSATCRARVQVEA